MRAACILTLAVGLTLAAPANAQFSYPAHGPRTLETDEADRAPQPAAEPGFHLLDPPSGPPAPGHHLLDPPSVTPVAPASGWGAGPQGSTVGERPAPRVRSYNMRPPNRATSRSVWIAVPCDCLSERGDPARQAAR